jgi:uncharacterized membrane protein YccC
MKTDKLLHLLVGYTIALTVGLWLPVWGLVAGIIAGATKELIYDKALGRGTYDVVDFLCTVAGAVIAFALTFIHAKLF